MKRSLTLTVALAAAVALSLSSCSVAEVEPSTPPAVVAPSAPAPAPASPAPTATQPAVTQAGISDAEFNELLADAVTNLEFTGNFENDSYDNQGFVLNPDGSVDSTYGSDDRWRSDDTWHITAGKVYLARAYYPSVLDAEKDEDFVPVDFVWDATELRDLAASTPQGDFRSAVMDLLATEAVTFVGGNPAGGTLTLTLTAKEALPAY